MLTAKIIFAASAGFLAGVFASPLLIEQPIPQQNLSTVAKPVTFNSTQKQENKELLAMIESMEAMLIEQNIRLESTEQGINYLLDSNTYAVETSSDIASEERTSEALEEIVDDTVDYQNVASYIEAQVQAGAWTRDNAYYMIEKADKLSHASRTEMQFKIVQAINDGRLQLEDPSVPIF